MAQSRKTHSNSLLPEKHPLPANVVFFTTRHPGVWGQWGWKAWTAHGCIFSLPKRAGGDTECFTGVVPFLMTVVFFGEGEKLRAI